MSLEENAQNVDISQLISEVSAEVDSLIKSESEKLKASTEENQEKNEKEKEAESENKEGQDMKKNEEKSSQSKPEAEKEEKKNLKKDDEGSYYEEQSPEMESEGGYGDEGQMQDPGDEELESLEEMVSGLDDEMLQELYQRVKMEMDSRQGGGEEAQMQGEPEAPAQQPMDQDQGEMAMKSESKSKENSENLKKAEERAKSAEEKVENLNKAMESMTDLLDKMVNRPVKKAVTDINEVDYVGKGDKESSEGLKKSELEKNPAKIKQEISNKTSDREWLATLSKGEREAITDFLTRGENKNKMIDILTR